MMPGFNTDFKYRGETYHIQTEDNGLGNPVVVTLLYHKGAILASRRTPYRDLAEKPGYERALSALMKTQHKDLMRALLAGTLDVNGSAPAVAGGSGEHPAVAAAAVIVRNEQPRTPREEVRPAGIGAVPVAPLAPTVSPAPAQPPRHAATTLDEAIRHYLDDFAATAAGEVR